MVPEMKSGIFICIIFCGFTLSGFSQSFSGEKEFGIGISVSDLYSNSYYLLSGSLNKKNHQLYSAIGYYDEDNSRTKDKIYNLTIGYKGYIFNSSKIFRGFGMLGGGGFYYQRQYSYTNCNLMTDEINYNTHGIILYWGFGGQFIIRNRFIIGLNAQLGWGYGKDNKLKYERYEANTSPPGCYPVEEFPSRTRGFFEALCFLFAEYHFGK